MRVNEESVDTQSINATQRNVLDAVFKFYFDDIAELDLDSALKALKAMEAPDVSKEDIEFFKQTKVWETVNAVRNILQHPCPQNRSVGDYGAALGAAGRRSEEPSLEDGVLDGEVYYFVSGFGSGVRHEPQGLLGLTARNDRSAASITKQAVVSYVHH